MTTELNPLDPPLSNGADHAAPVPVMGIEPVAPSKPKRKRKKRVAPKVARVPKAPRVDPLVLEEQQALAAGDIAQNQAVEEPTASANVVVGNPAAVGRTAVAGSITRRDIEAARPPLSLWAFTVAMIIVALIVAYLGLA